MFASYFLLNEPVVIISLSFSIPLFVPLGICGIAAASVYANQIVAGFRMATMNQNNYGGGGYGGGYGGGNLIQRQPSRENISGSEVERYL